MYSDQELASAVTAAQDGCPKAQCSLGCHYATLSQPDLKKSHFWYFQAAINGCPTAMYEIGFSILLGEGGRADATEATDWLEKAADSGGGCSEEAMRLLIDLYSDGLYDVPKNPNRASYWAERHKQRHHPL